jgi:hypothetical protein
MTSKARTWPPRALRSATPAMLRSRGRIWVSSRVRLSVKDSGPSMVNMNISPKGVVMGARPPVSPGGKSAITPARRSLTCWRAQ